MPPVTPAESGNFRPFTKTAGAEPLPGYTLIEPLGRGGFGEVWKCEAPGGLHKAIKFVPGAGAEDGGGERRLAQEFDAFQQIKAIRHPFLLTLERVELLDGELVMVMELADRQLQDRFRECRTCKLPGIPRDELLAYFADAAEALDMISAKFGLQHLDVKPANLFLVSGHVKVGDYGLVSRLDPDGPVVGNRGLTPKYVAPEALRGEPSDRSDQYSLALVYQELLTGTFPYNGKNPQQIMLQHVSAKPDLSGLPPVDQPIVAQALSKNPEERFTSCLAFVQSLMAAASAASLPGAGMTVRRARVERSMVDMNLPTAEPLEAEADSPSGGLPPAEITQNSSVTGVPTGTTPGPRSGLPRLVPTGQRPGAPVLVTPGPAKPPITVFADPLTSSTSRQFAIVLNPIKTVVPLGRLVGMDVSTPTMPVAAFAEALVGHAAAGAHVSHMPGDISRLADGTWVCQFPSTVPLSVVPIKLGVIRETWGVTLDQVEPTRLVMRRAVSAGGFWSSFSGKKASGLEITVRLPPPGKVLGEIVVAGSLFGTPDKEFARQADDVIPQLITAVKRELKNVEDRRKHARIAGGFRATVYPIHSNGGIDTPLFARVRDVSLDGIGLVTEAPLPTKYVYVGCEDVPAISGQAALVRLVRTQTLNRECISGGFFRKEL